MTYVLCDNCHNHYDDNYQMKECLGIGRGQGEGTGVTSHPKFQEKSVNAANAQAREANGPARRPFRAQRRT